MTDPVTQQALAGQPRDVFAVADVVKVVEAGSSTAIKRSRCVKTKLREALDGPFFYLDADALPLAPFGDVFSITQSFAAALDLNGGPASLPPSAAKCFRHFGWKCDFGRYVNSGVLFVNSTPQTYTVFDEWHRRWAAAETAFGAHKDQPILNSVLHEFGADVRILPRAYNAMVELSPWVCRGAIIYHFLADAPAPSGDRSIFHHLVSHYRATGTVDWDVVRRAAVASDPWVHPTAWLACELATGHYLSASKLILTRLFDGTYLNRALGRPTKSS